MGSKLKKQLARLVRRKRTDSHEADIDEYYKGIRAIDKLMESGVLNIDFLRGVATLESYLHLYLLNDDLKNDNDDKAYKDLCYMIRMWINHQRAYKKGDLLRMIDEKKISPDKEKGILKQYAPLPDHAPLSVVVVGFNGKPLACVEECKASGSLKFHILEEKPSEGNNE